MNNNPPTQHSSAPDKRPTAAATKTQHDEENEQVLRRDCDRADQMFLDNLNKETKENEENEQALRRDRDRAYLNLMHLKECVKKTERALYNEKDKLMAALKTEMKENANMPLELSTNYKRIVVLSTEAEKAYEQWEHEKNKPPPGRSFVNPEEEVKIQTIPHEL